MARPPTYQSDDERPTTVSVRIPQELYAQAKQYASMRRTTLTELLLDGLRLRLETPTDPRDIIVSHDITVTQELQEMIRTAVEKEVGTLRDFLGPQASAVGLLSTPAAPAEPVPELSHDDNITVVQEAAPAAMPTDVKPYYDNNTVIQEKGSQPRGRRSSPLRQQILTLLTEHPEGVSPEHIRVYLNPGKPIGDVLQGMRRAGVVHLRGEGYQKRYFVA